MSWIKPTVVPGLCLVLLTACGGGSDDNNTDSGADQGDTNQATVTLTPRATKTFSFSWNDVPKETEYRLLENPDGASGYSEVAVIPADSTAYDLKVSLPQRVNASYILQACNIKGCIDSDEVFVSSSLAEAVGYFKASNTEKADQFGYGVSLSWDGRVMAVSAAEEDNGAGAVYVFTDSNGDWSQQAYIKASNTNDFDKFGSSLALSSDGSVLAVGASREKSAATGINGDQTDNSANHSGAVYLFTQSDGTWSQQAYIKASNTEENDEFGISLALSADGGTLAVGAEDEDSNAIGIDGNQADNTVNNSGAVYVYTQSGDAWSQQAYIKASNTGMGDFFGSSLALSIDGNILAVGARGESSNDSGVDADQLNDAATSSGAVYIFNRDDGSWLQQAYIKASNPDAGDLFGSSLALSSDGSVLAVGARQEDSYATGINGNQSDNSAGNSGAVYLFAQSNGTWSQQAYIKASNTEKDLFGYSLALSVDGRFLTVGATAESSSAIGIDGNQMDNSAQTSGAVYVFAQNSGIWSQQAYIKASNTGGSDMFGYSLALSSDRSLLAVGASREGSSATGINGDQDDNTEVLSGAVYLY